MAHQLSLYEGALRVRISGVGEAQPLYHDLHNFLNNLPEPVTVIIDLTMASSFGRTLQAMLYRVLQHRAVENIGICFTDQDLAADVRSMATALASVRRVKVAHTEHELLAAYGLADPPTQPRRLSGMLSRLNNLPQKST
ncbi:MAG: hypothetical protein CUN49_04240 [Candidatus Thermofonsia Clade 1 bacterium]|jgi:hypothetical protein|uniref:Sigma-54 factor interaction domain-containing protein n=1 Tax=Candidatus Thermofonsia Clade 1 bacterium TaxID=2364210 RepID=A0A2M8PYX3_9CHLR|nr:MAG: hypothetical protein CUN49_04240 [Candidatus Thermofonsia Clade 1 bacterium]PJF42761.1 MAG: hypothetical protein CUN50_02875 [Candidatus Thermofonsia Clade 1 bacterium]RMF48999.1 MAG: hypothetical protein D6749_14300 [Chloroflexota bacterium]